MQIEGLIKRLKNASKNIFISRKDITNKHTDPHVFIRIGNKDVRITDITVSECNVYLEAEEQH